MIVVVALIFCAAVGASTQCLRALCAWLAAGYYMWIDKSVTADFLFLRTHCESIKDR